RKIPALKPYERLALYFYHPLVAAPDALGFEFYMLGEPIVLSDSLPMLEHKGVRVLGEQNHRIDSDAGSISLHDFELQASAAEEIEPDVLARLFEDCFARVFRGEV